MSTNEFERKSENLLMRVQSLLEAKVGTYFNNEALMMINSSRKANCSIRLFQKRGYDSGIASIMHEDSTGSFAPLEFSLTVRYRMLDYDVFNGSRPTFFKDFLTEDCPLDKERVKAMGKAYSDLSRKTKSLYKNSTVKDYLRIAHKYLELMRNPDFDFCFKDMLARLDLYHGLLKLDGRFAGLNIEQSMLIRREDHNRIVEMGDLYETAFFIISCLLDALYHGCDQLDHFRLQSEYASAYLATRMEKGVPYTIEELGRLFSMTTEMVRMLFVLPALGSDSIVVDSSDESEDRFTLIG